MNGPLLFGQMCRYWDLVPILRLPIANLPGLSALIFSSCLCLWPAAYQAAFRQPRDPALAFWVGLVGGEAGEVQAKRGGAGWAGVCGWRVRSGGWLGPGTSVGGWQGFLQLN